ncbi:hypothetical protein HMPREF0578_2236 [Mobiluncus mulieris 28-1]|uniref:Uncharacterized protein n=2 Tax=Mobiluncus mulieris TaxID=2052 RepID=E0QRP7_9ACTO|nr:glutamate dehydrogenase 2 [Mobiluncus mulieris]EEZ91157.1 hypothetical protein HMPREF0578_2236 [Mobiluncus mulieris 28-1]EFM45755.1 hypothetical protein HMPREF0580_1562 [Mobiluncus mulieris ATCC 35239]MBB5846065.1 glutamate dehydrogenase (NAD(P)+) [Mobiluncus mulieris]MCU9970270.1 glutamate dehydrogenase [Mobiluncus mulieris]MCU9974733.1 glutamate dehydrogenase [Mobiluncus mulieris]
MPIIGSETDIPALMKHVANTGKVVDFPGSEAIDPTQVLLLDVDVVVC